MQKSKTQKKKAFVGMSGGVDSSVSAALLKEQGYDVTGVFIKVWQPEGFVCTWRADRLDAMRVAAKLDIPFVTLNLEDVYKKEVVDYMISEYKAGRTPNPDVMCNKHVKFGGFFDWAMAQGADFVATGHYARREDRNGEAYLLTGRDANKDQTYFLWTLTQTQLAKTLFPVGDIEKPQVRKLAEKYGLATAEKKDSQGLCFIGKIDMKEFLRSYIEEKRGDVLNEAGEVIGMHDGAFYLTIGQRHGFTITKKTPDDAPYYIVAKDHTKNTVTVSQHPASVSGENKTVAQLTAVSWTRQEPDFSRIYHARIRYRQPLQEVRLVKTAHGIALHFTESQSVIAEGQSAVLYDNEECIGGGILA